MTCWIFFAGLFNLLYLLAAIVTGLRLEPWRLNLDYVGTCVAAPRGRAIRKNCRLLISNRENWIDPYLFTGHNLHLSSCFCILRLFHLHLLHTNIIEPWSSLQYGRLFFFSYWRCQTHSSDIMFHHWYCCDYLPQPGCWLYWTWIGTRTSQNLFTIAYLISTIDHSCRPLVSDPYYLPWNQERVASCIFYRVWLDRRGYHHCLRYPCYRSHDQA